MATSLVLAGGTGHADTVVYAQPAAAGSFIAKSAVQNVVGDPGFTGSNDADAEAWAYFTTPTTGAVNSITWYGTNADGAFAVDLFGVTCFSCGASLVGTDGGFTNNLLTTGPFSGASVTKTALAGSLFSYSITLPTAVTLQANSSYGFSVVNNYTALPFVWAGSASGPGDHLIFVVGQAIFLRSPGSLAFSLGYTTAPGPGPGPGPVPEPASWALMMLGVAGVGAVLRRRRSHVTAIAG